MRMVIVVSFFVCFVYIRASEFSEKKILLGNLKVTVMIADTNLKRQRGLMGRTKILKDKGMLFVFTDLKIRSFWMKNTFIPLSIGYFDANKTLVDIQQMAATTVVQKEIPSYPSKKPAQYALEVDQGWFKKNNIKVGTQFHYLKQK
ncbi:MAG: DUF192 domain-containing protein [Bdellovibrionaceae bacterium]|jgi:uncharacterized protein|nr:DUF192 domain-containing protein [Pseudobdellovibrionaceae bacterium]